MSLGLVPDLSLSARRAAAASATPIAVNFGAKTRLGFGGYPTTEAASSSLTGTNHGDFKVDDISTLAPAASGAGTYGAAWTQTGGATSYTLIGASLKHYAVTIVTGKIHIATRNGAPTHADSNSDPDRTQMYLTLRRATASGGPALGDDIVWRDGSIYNPTNGLWYLEPLTAAQYTGSGRITIRSETPDTAVDSNGNPRLQHSAKMGMVYFNPDGATVYPIDFRDIWWYTDAASPITGVFFQYANGSSGISFYNSRFEAGPDVLAPQDQGGIKPKGTCSVDGNYFKNLGTFAIIVDGSVAGTATISNNIFEGLWTDGINVAPNTIVSRNFGFGWVKHVGDHQDPVQGVAIATFGEMSENIWVNDLGGNVQSGFFLSDAVAFQAGGNIHNNAVCIGGTHGIEIDKADAPVIKFNTVLCDPFVNPGSLANCNIALTATGQNGSTITGNVANAVSVGTQPGVNTLDNCLFPVGVLTAAQLLAAYRVAFPNFPSSNTDPLWKTRAGVLKIFTPAQLDVGSGGVRKAATGTYYGYLFPAGTGQVNGALNDGTVPLLTDPTWLAAHPPAT